MAPEVKPNALPSFSCTDCTHIALNCITDLTTAITPMILVRHLQISRQVKRGIYACLALGLLCFVCSVGKMAQVDFSVDFTCRFSVNKYRSVAQVLIILTGTIVPSYIWSSFESKLAVIVGSLPALRQLYASIWHPMPPSGTPAYPLRDISSVRRSVMGSARAGHSDDGVRRKNEAYVELHPLPSNGASRA